ncbi:hypothetical protein PRIC2_013372 [Phytophthora ramorum]
MSFLVGDDDDDPTVVEEALAFIDSCGTEVEDSGASSGAKVDTEADDATRNADYQTRDRLLTKPKAKKRRIKTFASSSTRQLQRKKAEMTSLREQALVLQAHLNVLTRAKHSALAIPQDTSNEAQNARNNTTISEWYDRAVRHFVLRQQSENTNKQLKVILANQRQVVESLRGVLQRRSVLDGIDLVFGGSPPIYRPPQPLDNSPGLLKILEKHADNLYVDSKSGLGWNQPCLVSSKMNVNNNTQYGKVIEIETVTPVECSIQQASSILWKDLNTVHDIPDKRYRYLRGSKPNSLEKSFVMTLRGEQSDIEINGSHFSRKFEESQRIVLVKADSIILQTQGLEFRSPSWTVITASEVNPRVASVVRSYLRIYAEVEPNLAGRVEDVERTRDFVLNELSKMMYGCALKTQGELIQQSFIL